jgi:hypothetical protein
MAKSVATLGKFKIFKYQCHALKSDSAVIVISNIPHTKKK